MSKASDLPSCVWRILGTVWVISLATGMSWVPIVQGDVLVSSRFSNNVLRYDDNGAFVGVFAQGSELLNPNGIAFGPDGHLYVGLGDVGKILKYDGETGNFIGEFVPQGSGGLGGVRDILFGPDGDLYVASGTTDEVLQFDGNTGAFVGVAAAGNGLDGPVGLAFGPQGKLYIAAALSNKVFVFNNGVFEQSFDAGPSHSNAVGLAFNSNNQLLVSQSVTNEVLAFDPVTGSFHGVFVDGPPGIPIYMQVSDDGLLHVGAFLTDSVWRYDALTGALIDQFIAPGSGGLNGTHDIVFFPDPQPVVVPAESVDVVLGTNTEGELADTNESDDIRFCFFRGNPFAVTQPSIWLDFESTLPTDSPSSMTLIVEAQADSNDIDQRIWAFNFDNSQWELLDTTEIGFNNDTVVSVDVTGDVDRFVEMGTGTVRMRVTYTQGPTSLFLAWSACLDQVVWQITP